MTTFTPDPADQAFLAKVAGLTEVRDAGGNVLGFFSPVTQHDAEAYARAAASFDRAEMQRRKNSPEPGRTTPDVLNRITSQD
jgi:hypothetical protein